MVGRCCSIDRLLRQRVPVWDGRSQWVVLLLTVAAAGEEWLWKVEETMLYRSSRADTRNRSVDLEVMGESYSDLLHSVVLHGDFPGDLGEEGEMECTSDE